MTIRIEGRLEMTMLILGRLAMTLRGKCRLKIKKTLCDGAKGFKNLWIEF
jgi:hypothetical protein